VREGVEAKKKGVECKGGVWGAGNDCERWAKGWIEGAGGGKPSCVNDPPWCD